MSCANNRAVVFVIERGATKIDKPNVCSFYAPDVPSLKKEKPLLNTSERDALSYILCTVYSA